ncbi:MAG TPA: hypothetical protein VD862_03745 [Candidatus Paceibacterota bacterium]|nr:hypothetical protein [Candidatus Paceibacterota bacterium]
MPVGYCPGCDKALDLDGFAEHGVPTPWYCYCGKLYAHGPEFFQLTEVPQDQVDMTDRFPYGNVGRTPERGEFIMAVRFARVRKAVHDTAYEEIARFVREGREGTS